MLSEKQISSFKNDGVLLIKNFFSKEEIEAWREEVHHYYHYPKTDLDWKNAIMKYPGSHFSLQNDADPSSHIKMKALYNCFHDEIKWIGESKIVARRPEMGAEWLGARTPHLDFPVYANIRTLANSVFYLNDTTETGGPFMYWKGSHITAWNYFKKNPKDYMAKGDLSQGQIFEKLTKMMDSEAVAFYGEAGDLLIWHSLLLHSPAVNLSHQARLAIIGRWGTQINEHESRFNFEKSIWENWGENIKRTKLLKVI